MFFQQQYNFSGLACRQLLLVLILLPVLTRAQQSGVTDSAANKGTSVRLIADARVEILAHYSETSRPGPTPTAVAARRSSVTGSIRSTPGFRVIIYSGTDRNKANGAKIDFMRRYPGMRVYMSYALPQYRVKVGDFTSRADAAGLYHQLNKVYSPCLIVPDIVEINTFHRANDPVNSSKEP